MSFLFGKPTITSLSVSIKLSSATSATNSRNVSKNLARQTIQRKGNTKSHLNYRRGIDQLTQEYRTSFRSFVNITGVAFLGLKKRLRATLT